VEGGDERGERWDEMKENKNISYTSHAFMISIHISMRRRMSA
jgi:hypothetical protein